MLDLKKKRRDYTNSLCDPNFKRENNLERTINPTTLIDKIERLIDQKLKNESVMTDMANSSNDVKIRCLVANKSKDSVSDLVRTGELLRGNPTDNVFVSDAERASRRNRLVAMAIQVDNKGDISKVSTLVS